LIVSPLLRAGRVDGTIALSGALPYDAAARPLRPEKPKAERLELQGVSGGRAEAGVSTLRMAYGAGRAEAAAMT
jgi:hypothetical protein